MNDNVSLIKQKLMHSLGDKEQEYLRLMNLWFKMKLNKEEFDNKTRKLMNPDQIHLHNQLLLNLLYKCAYLPSETPKVLEAPRRTYDYMIGNFEPLDPTSIVVTERREVIAEAPPYLIHDHLLPDHPFIMARLMYGAWELGLEGSTSETADLLLVATLQFLKNILTAIISWRKGCKLDGRFLHSIGEPILNPWLRNVALKMNKKKPCLRVDHDGEEVLIPSKKLSQEKLIQERAFRLAASDFHDELEPISSYDLLSTLKIYPNLLASNFIHSVNCERIMARITHPSWDD